MLGHLHIEAIVFVSYFFLKKKNLFLRSNIKQLELLLTSLLLPLMP